MKTNKLKWCYACKQWLSNTAFGKNKSKKDGLATECKKCKRILDAKSHWKNRDKRLAKMKEYQKEHYEELRIKAIQYSRSSKGREINNKATRKYYQNNKEKITKSIKKRRENSPLQYRSQYQLSNAVKLGHIKRPTHCRKCGKKTLVEGHHPDYSKPFEVEWLCKRCHSLLSRKAETLI